MCVCVFISLEIHTIKVICMFIYHENHNDTKEKKPSFFFLFTPSSYIFIVKSQNTKVTITVIQTSACNYEKSNIRMKNKDWFLMDFLHHFCFFQIFFFFKYIRNDFEKKKKKILYESIMISRYSSPLLCWEWFTVRNIINTGVL